MDWPLAITRNRDALLAIVATIAGLIGGRADGLAPRRIRNAALALLRPAESAARRLIVVAAQGLRVVLAARTPPAFGGHGRANGQVRPLAFPLFDRRKPLRLTLSVVEPRGVPRVRFLWSTTTAPPTPPAPPARPTPRALADIRSLERRLHSLAAALANLPRQAKRLARLRARRAATLMPAQPLRLGHPPGHRRSLTHKVDLVLRECHALAVDALAVDTLAADVAAADTS